MEQLAALTVENADGVGGPHGRSGNAISSWRVLDRYDRGFMRHRTNEAVTSGNGPDARGTVVRRSSEPS